MIARYWKGVTKSGLANAYQKHLNEETFVQLSLIPGYIKASLFKRKTNQGTEFVVITLWNTFEDIKQFAGKSFEIAVVPTKVKDMMIEYDHKVAHYEVLEV